MKTSMLEGKSEPLNIFLTKAGKSLSKHVEEMKKLHLRTLLQDIKRYPSLLAEHDGVFIDFSRQLVTEKTMGLLFDLAETADVYGQIKAMRDGLRINMTENRAVLHVALRASADQRYDVDGKNVMPEIHRVLNQINAFSEDVRTGKLLGATGKRITDVVAIGIGGSYLGAKFVSEVLDTDPESSRFSQGRKLRFLSNVDPVAVKRTLTGLNPETTLVVVISKTFTTTETMINARALRQWLQDGMAARVKSVNDIVEKHMAAVSTNPEAIKAFGIRNENFFTFWDFVGGRFSVCSAVGILPLALQYSYKVCDRFLAGARSIDDNFLNATPRNNLPLILGLLGIWNSSFLNHSCRAIACYSEALMDFAQHVQQIDMESNGKAVLMDGRTLVSVYGAESPMANAGEMTFGERGTNCQHSYFQLFHQGRVVPVDFIGACVNHSTVEVKDEPLNSHDELMANFFAQPDALAYGKLPFELKAEGCAEHLIPHKSMPGNRPSTVILFSKFGAYEIGQLLALYEHRTAVQGFVWGINSWDQFGVELGKSLASQVRSQIVKGRQVARREGKSDAAGTPAGGPAIEPTSPKENDFDIQGFNISTAYLLKRYLTLSSSTAAKQQGQPAAAGLMHPASQVPHTAIAPHTAVTHNRAA